VLRQILSSTRLYDAAQYAAGAGLIRDHLTRRLVDVGSATVLDVGAGTGLYASCLPDTARYIWFDNDAHKLRGFIRRGGGRAIIGDATSIALADKSVDFAMCTHVAHHLNDRQAEQFMSELARVTRRRIVVQDAVGPSGPASRLLWSIDKGSYPRTREQLLSLMSKRFTIAYSEEYSRFHTYLLVIATPII
jgi:ubiquinone/menaquinone biosynthesis C-methylase UbiE